MRHHHEKMFQLGFSALFVTYVTCTFLKTTFRVEFCMTEPVFWWLFDGMWLSHRCAIWPILPFVSTLVVQPQKELFWTMLDDKRKHFIQSVISLILSTNVWIPLDDSLCGYQSSAEMVKAHHVLVYQNCHLGFASDFGSSIGIRFWFIKIAIYTGWGKSLF